MAVSGEYIYKRMWDYYAGRQMPANNQGVFFDTPNFTQKRCIECIEFLQNNYGSGWFTEDSVLRQGVLNTLAGDLYAIFDGQVDRYKIYKFLCWVYSFAKTDQTAIDYFKNGVSYGALSYYTEKVANKITGDVKKVADNVNYGVSVPTITSDGVTTGLDNFRTILKLLPIAAVAGLIGWALLTDKN